ncbi:unnamed protein product, partial [Effrenium voratum]
ACHCVHHAASAWAACDPGAIPRSHRLLDSSKALATAPTSAAASAAAAGRARAWAGARPMGLDHEWASYHTRAAVASSSPDCAPSPLATRGAWQIADLGRSSDAIDLAPVLLPLGPPTAWILRNLRRLQVAPYSLGGCFAVPLVPVFARRLVQGLLHDLAPSRRVRLEPGLQPAIPAAAARARRLLSGLLVAAGAGSLPTDTKEVAAEAGLPDPQVRRMLRRLLEEGRVRQRRRGRQGGGGQRHDGHPGLRGLRGAPPGAAPQGPAAGGGQCGGPGAAVLPEEHPGHCRVAREQHSAPRLQDE